MIREVDALIKKAQDSISGAKVLLDNEFYNFSVSRSYYAMFYIAEALLLTKGLSYSTHKGVISGFGEHFVKQELFDKKFGKELNKVYELRIYSDYEIEDEITKNDAQKYLKLAKEFLKEAKRYLKRKK